MKYLIVNIIVTTIVSATLTIYVIPRFKPSNETKVETEVVADTTEVKPDTLTFEQEMAIVDSAIQAQDGVVYKDIYEVPDRDVHYKFGGWNQTFLRHANGMPKIVAAISRNEKYTEFWVKGTFLLFLDDNGRVIAEGERPNRRTLGRWHCKALADTLAFFRLSNPNLCMNIK